MATGMDQTVSVALNSPVPQKREAREDWFGNGPWPTPLPKPCPVTVWESAHWPKPNLCQRLLEQCNLPPLPQGAESPCGFKREQLFYTETFDSYQNEM